MTDQGRFVYVLIAGIITAIGWFFLIAPLIHIIILKRPALDVPAGMPALGGVFNTIGLLMVIIYFAVLR